VEDDAALANFVRQGLRQSSFISLGL
jgi:hypothetical protein